MAISAMAATSEAFTLALLMWASLWMVAMASRARCSFLHVTAMPPWSSQSTWQWGQALALGSDLAIEGPFLGGALGAEISHLLAPIVGLHLGPARERAALLHRAEIRGYFRWYVCHIPTCYKIFGIRDKHFFLEDQIARPHTKAMTNKEHDYVLDLERDRNRLFRELCALEQKVKQLLAVATMAVVIAVWAIINLAWSCMS